MASNARDVMLPAEALLALRKTLSEEIGPLPAIQALQTAGYRTGALAHPRLAEALGGDVATVSDARFWTVLSDFFSERGWGELTQSAPHPAIGLLSCPDCAEAEGASGPQPSCHFTSGLLAGILSKAAGGPIAVLQVACRGSGDDRCDFAFGAEATMQRLYGLLRETEGDLGTALGRL